MPNKMLIDASHPEETRVVVVRGSRIEEFDFESQDKKQLKGNIYLARVTRVEPSLQAAFVEYGGNRHGFLAFSEIHPDYYQIPLADRQALLRADAEDSDEDEEGEAEERGRDNRRRRGGRNRRDQEKPGGEANGEKDSGEKHSGENELTGASAEEKAEAVVAAAIGVDSISEAVEGTSFADEDSNGIEEIASAGDDNEVETVGPEDALEEIRSSRRPARRQYKIQEVIKRRQILLVQVVKEERGNKGAALTTYLSLAGRYSVLMPNTARGGGISRKITNASDRKRLKEVVQDLNVPEGMGVILRTAGESRTKAEIKRDYEYLMRMWENVRSLTLRSTAPALVYEEGSLIKRSVRDLYNKDISEILVAGEEGYREAKDFMRMLMPSHAKVVQPHRESTPIFACNGIEAQLDRMLQPQSTLKSGGYIIINQTEALVSIDVNSGRSTKEHSIEDTALQTNLEAAEEVARQLRLRDLAGLIVIDFIDMEENRNNRAVEKRLKDCLKNDRARIQVGRISHFGLLEMSRQRIRASVLESTMKTCPNCGGTGHVRSDSSVALLVVRAIEEFLLKDNRHHITVRTPSATALYVLNHKRSTLVDLERRFGLTITLEADDSFGAQHYGIFRGAAVENPVEIAPLAIPLDIVEEIEPEEEIPLAEDMEEEEEASGEQQENGENQRDRKRRRRRRRRGKDRDREVEISTDAEGAEASAYETVDDETESEDTAAEAVEAGSESERKKRRRGKRGGRRHRHEEAAGADAMEESDEAGRPLQNAEAADEPAVESAAEEVQADMTVATVEEMPAEKPKRKPRRTARAKEAKPEIAAAAVEPIVATEETVPASVDETVPDSVDEAVEASVEEAAEASGKKPKRAPKRATRTRKAEKEVAAVSGEDTLVTAVAAEAVDASEAVEAPVEKPKRAPRRTAGTKKAQTKVAAASTEAAAASEEVGAAPEEKAVVTEAVEVPAEKPKRAPRRTAAAKKAEPKAAKAGAAEKPTAAKAEATAPSPADVKNETREDAKPKKAGWWQRKGFF